MGFGTDGQGNIFRVYHGRYGGGGGTCGGIGPFESTKSNGGLVWFGTGRWKGSLTFQGINVTPSTVICAGKVRWRAP